MHERKNEEIRKMGVMDENKERGKERRKGKESENEG